MKKELLESFYRAILNGDETKAFLTLQKDFAFYHLNFRHYFGTIQNQLPNRRFNPNGKLEVKYVAHDIYQIFLDNRLIAEENFLFKIGFLSKLYFAGTKSKYDCFGKIAYRNFKPKRVLTVRTPRGIDLKSIVFSNPIAKCKIYKGTTFENDGFYSCELEIEGDDLSTKTASATLETTEGTFKQYFVLRGIDYPYHDIKHPRFTQDGKGVLLNNDPEKIFMIEATFANGQKIQEQFPTRTEYKFEEEMKSFYMFVDGTAFNYYYDFLEDTI
ncbi:MAG: hypothetical protein VB138_01820 [Burkholderia sp.]